MLLDLVRCGLERGQCRLCRSSGRPACRRWIVARDRKHRENGIADILQNVASARYDARHDQIKEGIQELNDPLLRKLISESAETAHVGEQHCRLEVAEWEEPNEPICHARNDHCVAAVCGSCPA